MSIRINPSILAADFANFQRELQRIATADSAHVDIMDAHFVPNLTFGLPMVERLAEVSPVPLDVHLMIDDPDRWAADYASAGGDSVTFHVEAAADAVAVARSIRAKGARAGAALKPGTPLEPWIPLLDEIDMLLVMTVEPGFGGQEFMPSTMDKLRAAAELAAERGGSLHLQVDGGITLATIRTAAENGADTFVAGSSVFRSDDPAEAIASLRKTAEKAARAL
ncbi:ribulose-phosphate 3-epimerase [Herbiconiux sp. L3-i23]|uniref:ribulose-phosphate 3-epimerase n=1 Tax=Herbiconiux sp. L3-i23 TaxID=2905871 RepID=UPI00206BFA4F|nr:ribulose-phosphate 3-epimerase [Herbiconiux sp. L3-i23]BDI22769.1 ribulose-phosphate 3-epimerase [Herbiconiux sp. L3-i23]